MRRWEKADDARMDYGCLRVFLGWLAVNILIVGVVVLIVEVVNFLNYLGP